jgi:hypothetical protein
MPYMSPSGELMYWPKRNLFTTTLKLTFSLSLLIFFGACGSSSDSPGTPVTPQSTTPLPSPSTKTYFTSTELYGKYWTRFSKEVDSRLRESDNVLDAAMLLNGFHFELLSTFPEVEILLNSSPSNPDEARSTLARIEKVLDSYSRYLQRTEQVADSLAHLVDVTQTIISDYKQRCITGPAIAEIPPNSDSEAYVTDFKKLCSEKVAPLFLAEKYLALPELPDINSNDCDNESVKISDVAVNACRAAFAMAVSEHYGKEDRQDYDLIKEHFARISTRASEIRALTGP